MTVVCIFKEYSGIEIPELPFEFKIDRAGEFMPPGTDNCMNIYKTNVKVFEKDSVKRELILDIFTRAGFIFVTDELITKTKNGIVRCRDRLVFTSPLAN